LQNKQQERGKTKIKESDTLHRVRLYRVRLSALGSRRRKRVPIVVEPHVEGPPIISWDDSYLGLGDLRKLHHASSHGIRAVKQDLGQFDLAGRLEQPDKVFIRRRIANRDRPRLDTITAAVTGCPSNGSCT